MEYINIISKEEIYGSIAYPVYIAGALAIAGVLGSMIYFFITKKLDTGVKALFTFGFGGMTLMFITVLVCNIFFKVPTGKYRYEATVDKDKITVSQYEEFIEEYNPTIKDGVYYWEE